MKVDYSVLAGEYSAMTAEEFELVNREDLADEAKPYYDREKARRVPGWKYEEPTTEAKVQVFSLLQERIKRRYVIHKTVLFALIACCCVISWLVPVGHAYLIIWLDGISFLLVFMMMYREQSLGRRTGYTVLWLRRFHRREQKSFQRILERACLYVGMPITVQDSSFRFSLGYAMSRLIPLVSVLLGVYVALSFIPVSAILFDGLAMAMGLSMVLAVLISFWLGVLKLRVGDSERRVLKLLEDIRTGRVWNAGVFVLSCQDDFWRSVVELALRHADTTVVDVTQLSENVIWELHTALAEMPPERVLLVCEKDAAAPEVLPSSVISELQAALPNVPLDRFPKFFYCRTRNYFFSPPQEPVSSLRESLLKCISQAPAHDTRGAI